MPRGKKSDLYMDRHLVQDQDQDQDQVFNGGYRRLAAMPILFALLTACGEPISDETVAANLFTLAAFDPDFTDIVDPVPGRVLWISTRAGTGRFLSGGTELTDVPRVAVDGGELVTTAFEPEVLAPGYNDIEIRFALERHGTTELTASARLFVSVDCTTHDHCRSGACVDYDCVE